MRFRHLIPILCVLLLAGCSMAKLAYDYADRLLLHEFDSYVGLTNAQKVVVLDDLRSRLATHQQEELPEYHRFLQNTRDVLADGLTREEVDRAFDRVKELYDLGVKQTLPLMARTLTMLQPEQLNYLADRLADDEADIRERLDDSDTERYERRVERSIENIERWTGDLDEAQRELIAGRVAEFPDTTAAWLAYRRTRLGGLIELLRGNSDQASVEAYLAANWLDHQQLDPALEAQWEAQANQYRDMLVALDQTLTSRQRQNALETLDEYVELATSLLPENLPLASAN